MIPLHLRILFAVFRSPRSRIPVALTSLQLIPCVMPLLLFVECLSSSSHLGGLSAFCSLQNCASEYDSFRTLQCSSSVSSTAPSIPTTALCIHRDLLAAAARQNFRSSQNKMHLLHKRVLHVYYSIYSVSALPIRE